MKKYLIGIFAMTLVVAVTTAFSSKKLSSSLNTQFYWYDASTGSSLGFGEYPNNGCTAPGAGCARGFNTPQTDPLNVTPDETVANN